MKYRAEIDGLRALAVVPVILFHAGFELFSGGFVGVDVFFVISGYLITTILIEDIENKRFSIVNFYERRARRILPALFFVMLVCIPFAWIWMLPSQMKDFSQSLVAVSLFASNVLFWRESGYFDEAAEEKPLLHTWSLAVEEQYYVLFPIFLILAWRFGKNRVFWMVVVMAATSLLLSEWGWRNKTTANFYLAPTRVWELFAGSITAFIVQKRGVQKNNPLALLGLAAIIFSIFAYDESTPFPSVYALVPVMGVVLLVLYAAKDTFAAKLLSAKAFVGVGLISYSAYLWHQPLFAFARVRVIEHPSKAILMLLLSIISIILAYGSWHYIEKPFRNRKLIQKKTIFITSFFSLSFFILLGLFVHFGFKTIERAWTSRQDLDKQVLYTNFFKEQQIHKREAAQGSITKLSGCRLNARELTDELIKVINQCYVKYGKGVLILGDSHAIDLFGAVTSKFEHPFIIGVTQGGCRPHKPRPECHYDGVQKFIANSPEIFSLVIFEQAGFYLLKSSDGKKGSRKIFNSLAHNESVLDISIDTEHVVSVVNYLDKIASYIPVKWFLPRVEPHISRPYILKNGCEFDYVLRPNQYNIFNNLDGFISKYIDSIENQNLSWQSQNETFKFDFNDDFISCPNVYWSDGDHFSSSGEKYFGERLPMDFLTR